jgi:hypothetical protein
VPLVPVVAFVSSAHGNGRSLGVLISGASQVRPRLGASEWRPQLPPQSTGAVSHSDAGELLRAQTSGPSGKSLGPPKVCASRGNGGTAHALKFGNRWQVPAQIRRIRCHLSSDDRFSLRQPASRSATRSTSRSSPPRTPRESGSRKTTPKAWLLSMKFWNKRGASRSGLKPQIPSGLFASIGHDLVADLSAFSE